MILKEVHLNAVLGEKYKNKKEERRNERTIYLLGNNGLGDKPGSVNRNTSDGNR